jgi:hypothetical protein
MALIVSFGGARGSDSYDSIQLKIIKKTNEYTHVFNGMSALGSFFVHVGFHLGSYIQI